ncbi:MAG: hypothetical protein GY861_20540 [bacterium]|nr:hypothetical protein [bacterium]
MKTNILYIDIYKETLADSMGDVGGQKGAPKQYCQELKQELERRHPEVSVAIELRSGSGRMNHTTNTFINVEEIYRAQRVVWDKFQA